MLYRVCKAFEIESGHMLSKHPDRCRFPHGHSRRVELVLSSDRLDENDMVCDFKALKLAVAGFLDDWDHAMAINSADPMVETLAAASGDRLIVFENEDPTTEVLARRIFEHLEAQIRGGVTLTDERGGTFRLPPHVRVERVRVGETSTSWAEYGQG
ncbi:MAG: 6-pyruvoyl trahydropterin synthase family protein [Phycisphaerales bacterium JB059]